MADTHSIMPKKLAQALMEAGVKHFDSGGMFDNFSNTANTLGTAGMGGLGALGQQITGNDNAGLLSGKGGAQAHAPDMGKGLGMTSQEFGTPLDINTMQRQSVYNNQSNLANQLIAQSRGQGPNPALDQLHQTTGQNVQNQGALMASQRGASANPALIARQAAMQGGAIQQQATGQAATLAAQQQLAAGQQAGQVYGTMGQQAGNAQSTLQGALAAQNASAVNQQVGFGNMQTNASMANAQGQNGLMGGLMQGAASGAALALLNKGGEVPKYAEGGGINHYDVAGSSMAPLKDPQPAQNPIPGLGSLMGGAMGGGGGGSAYSSIGTGTGGGGGMQSMSPYADGGQIPFSTALVNGGKVKGKAEVSGDSEKNDTSPALLSPGEVVLPRSVTMAKNAPQRAKEFMAHIQSTKKGSGGYGDVIKSRKMCGGGRV